MLEKAEKKIKQLKKGTELIDFEQTVDLIPHPLIFQNMQTDFTSNQIEQIITKVSDLEFKLH